MLRRSRDGVRLLGRGELKTKLNIEVHGASKSAMAAVEKAGGSVKILRTDQLAELFEKKRRTRTEPMKPREGLFAFYDSSARPGYDAYRALLNNWLSELPKADQAEMIARFRTGTDLQYEAAIAELTVHAAMKRQGYVIEVHPACGHPTRRPDFRAKRGEEDGIVVEVTTFTPGVPEVSQSKRDADVYNALDNAKLPAGWSEAWR